ncbi:MAG TPA: hypothetical protein VGJ78_00950 [Vicinamibacterales bacterium]|jgi:hypothetical protein
MNELIEKGIGLFPQYFRDLIALLTGPKRFVAGRLHEEGLFERSLLFLAFSYASGCILKAPTYTGNLLVELGAGAAFTLAQAAGFGIAIWFAWRAVGGRGTLVESLVISFYYAGVIELLATFMYVSFMGTLRAGDVSLYTRLLEAARNGAMVQLVLDADRDRVLDSRPFQLALLIALPFMAAFAAWVIAGWGAYRAQHGVGRLRSVLAFFLFVVFSLPVAALTFVIANGLVTNGSQERNTLHP